MNPTRPHRLSRYLPRRPLGRSILASLGVHGLLLLALSLPLARPRTPVFADPIYQVALVEWAEPNLQPPVPAAAETTPEEKPPPDPEPEPPPEPAPDPEPVVLPEPEPRKPAPPKPDPPRPDPTPTKAVEDPPPSPVTVDVPAPSDEPVSLGVVDQKDFRHNYYLELVRSLLAREWHPPTGREGIQRAVLHFVIHRDGTIVTPETRVSSGWSVYDRAALAAVLRVRKLPPLPEAYEGESLGLTVTFQRRGESP